MRVRMCVCAANGSSDRCSRRRWGGSSRLQHAGTDDEGGGGGPAAPPLTQKPHTRTEAAHGLGQGRGALAELRADWSEMRQRLQKG